MALVSQDLVEIDDSGVMLYQLSYQLQLVWLFDEALGIDR